MGAFPAPGASPTLRSRREGVFKGVSNGFSCANRIFGAVWRGEGLLAQTGAFVAETLKWLRRGPKTGAPRRPGLYPLTPVACGDVEAIPVQIPYMLR